MCVVVSCGSGDVERYFRCPADPLPWRSWFIESRAMNVVCGSVAVSGVARFLTGRWVGSGKRQVDDGLRYVVG